MRAGFYGVAGWHGEGHLLRALFEGVAFEHRRHIDVLRSAGMRFDSAILSGGGARSPIWPQMFADILGIPITVADCAETGALGAAIAAGVGAGVFPDLAAGVAHHDPRPAAAFAADPAMAAHYDDALPDLRHAHRSHEALLARAWPRARQAAEPMTRSA